MFERLIPATRPTVESTYETAPWIKALLEPENAAWIPFAGTRLRHPDVYFGKQTVQLERQPVFDMFVYTEPHNNHEDLVIAPQKGIETAWANDLDWWI